MVTECEQLQADRRSIPEPDIGQSYNGMESELSMNVRFSIRNSYRRTTFD